MQTEIIHKLVDALIPYARNTRTHSDDQIAQIAASIREFGFLNPVITDGDNGIIAGHGRVMAARKLLIEKVPTIDASHLSEAQKRAYIIADNKLALNAGWDEDLLAIEISDLKGLDFDLDIFGFTDDEIEKFLADNDGGTEGLTDPDDISEAQDRSVVVPGDLWILGDHRLMCGDSTSNSDVEMLMDGNMANVCFTSPPYGQQRDYGAAKEIVSDWDSLMTGVFCTLPVKDDAQILVNLGLIHKECEWVAYWSSWLDQMRYWGWRKFGLYVWDQGPGLPGDWSGRFAPSFELIFHFNKSAIKINKWVDKKPESIKLKGGSGLRKADGSMSGVSNPEAGFQESKIPDNVIRINRQATEKLGHPAAFPVNLSEYVLKSFASSGDIAYEPFSGSGSTLIACEKNGFLCYGMELDPKYCDVIITRWQNFTGQQAVLENDGRTFAEISALRVN